MRHTTAASVASLRSRLARLDEEISRREAAAAQHASAELVTTLPPPTQWPRFAARTFIRSGDEEGGKVMRFVPYAFQAALIRRIHADMNTLVLKSRQIGISETICSYLALRALREPGFTAVVISKNQKDSSELATRVTFMVESLDREPLEWTSKSSTKISWKGRGTLHFMPATEKSGRGIPACSVLFLDEAAFIDLAEGIYQGAAPALAKLGKAGKIIVVSTPDLEANWYGRLWNEGLPAEWYEDYVVARRFAPLQALLDSLPGRWRRVALHYSMHPEFGKDPGWAQRMREDMRYTQMQWDAEFELRFGSTSSVIYPSKLVNAGVAKHLSLAECGDIGRTYLLGIDPNGGGDDYFVGLMLDITAKPYRVAALYREHNRSTPYSLRHIKDLVENFRPDGITIERNSMGVVIAEALQGEIQAYNVETIFMNRTNKAVLTDRVLYLLEQGILQYPDGIIPQELKAFRRTETGDREAAAGYHDDTVIGLALACNMIPGLPDMAAFLRKA